MEHTEEIHTDKRCKGTWKDIVNIVLSLITGFLTGVIFGIVLSAPIE